MKTTIEIPDEIFQKAKAIAALRDESLREFVIAALEARLRSLSRWRRYRSGWRIVFGLARPSEVNYVDRIITADLETVKPRDRSGR